MVVAAREWLSNAPRIGRVARPAPQARSDNVVGFTEPEPVIEIAPENRKRIVVDLVGVGWARGTGPVRPIFGLRSWCDPSPSLANKPCAMKHGPFDGVAVSAAASRDSRCLRAGIPDLSDQAWAFRSIRCFASWFCRKGSTGAGLRGNGSACWTAARVYAVASSAVSTSFTPLEQTGHLSA
jgi:hypothetical protein